MQMHNNLIYCTDDRSGDESEEGTERRLNEVVGREIDLPSVCVAPSHLDRWAANCFIVRVLVAITSKSLLRTNPTVMKSVSNESQHSNS